MGRTLHYDVERDSGLFTKEEICKMISVSRKYNSGKFKGVWSCENFYCDPLHYYPNWESPAIKALQWKSSDGGWKLVDSAFKKLRRENLDYVSSVLKLHADGLILFHNKDPYSKIHGFVKVQGNEYNSMLVLQALIEISQHVPHAIIKLYDEGEFLLCELTIQNGKAKPNVSGIMSNIAHHCLRIVMGNDNHVSKMKFADKLSGRMRDDMHIKNTYGTDDLIGYIDNELRNLSIIESRVSGLMDGTMVCLWNIGHMEFDPWLFTRKVDIDKFVNYKMTPGTLMDGFKGEGFGLTDEDSEAASYKHIGTIMNMLKKAGFSKKQVRILGE